MSQPIRTTSPAVLNTGMGNPRHTVLECDDLTHFLLAITNELNLQLVNKKFNLVARSITKKNWTDLQQLARVNSPSGPTEFQKKHPTLSSYIFSGQIANYAGLITHLRNEAQILGITNSREYQTFRSSIGKGDILALDRLIEQTIHDRASGAGNRLWTLFGTDVELPEIRNYETWNETVRTVDISGIIALDLSNNGLTRIPFGVFHLQSLQHLNLRSNQLTALPPIGQLQALQQLNLRRNKLTALPPGMEQLQKLYNLDFFLNPIHDIPEYIIVSPHLTYCIARRGLVEEEKKSQKE